MIDMHVYLLEKYRSPFLHGVFLFSKVGVLTVNFNGFFALAYSSHLLTSRKSLISSYFFVIHPLSQGLPILPGIFLERESESQPYQEFLIAPQLDHAPKYSIRVWG